ncbi:MAG TPA: HAD family hydrolase [Arcobacter sp.]|nr:HAD family hydrolase [Arcobacter sp.]HIP56432.1 HAD family hydrolase [Arcobacter sp.]
MKKYILFDNDGVLVETEMWYYEASKKALKEFFNIDLLFEDYMKIMARGGTAWEKAIEAGISHDNIVKARKQRNIYYQEYLQTKDIAIPNVTAMLEELSKNYKMAIVTTSRRVDFEIIHKHSGIVEFMDFVLCEEDYTKAKPHPEPYLTALTKFGASKEEIVIVEDSQRGLTSAYKAGIECVMVYNEFTKTQDFSKATAKIEKLEDLLAYLN